MRNHEISTGLKLGQAHGSALAWLGIVVFLAMAKLSIVNLKEQVALSVRDSDVPLGGNISFPGIVWRQEVSALNLPLQKL